ncbi:TldD/PmbA family protein [Granulibacter bethesdensis]|uniref:Microcin-processing peptidase 1 (PmbA) n=1 Tax=Granulibacter bethesdensis (strain ATCC BAA-1260 / CGDNIH1) TaxID=391165 RepID=Q0BPU9_GRABC|nr:metallopeptidase TldD-related protein [Granulibacter bethesdensis]ABI63153.1 Microcin-processing peptidase 1 (PmbA) [Granulibacter bethesdensis CGDNIH1]AHJ67875.1 Microcin-processing peptidase 1 (PmbA) [Granulibacter bethesdensis]APH53030.1 Microcin-processing peptidase 1 (PmbA) [Granulibacter bethesdensis]APH65719.1 Microcin-processing peptidase 1 (PmbA) [Granulibacter bethesdensis]
MSTYLDLIDQLLTHAKRAGADAADALIAAGTSLSVQRRLGQTEHVERSEGRDLGLRVLVGQRSAVVSSSALDPSGFARLAEQAVAMARVVPEDPYLGLGEVFAPADATLLDLNDPSEPDADALGALAGRAEEAALAVSGVTNSEGCEAGYGKTDIALGTSAGFRGAYARTSFSFSATALAGTGTGMERDYDYSTAVHLSDLEQPELIGRTAGEKAVARLNPGRVKTARMPVIFDPRVSNGLIGHLAGAINGASVARGGSFLQDRLGQRLFRPGIVMRDDPSRRRGLRSRPFDGEGQPVQPLSVIEDGVLTSWILDLRSARQLGLHTTGHAARGTGGGPSPAVSNFYLEAGMLSPMALMADIREGLYITETMGPGVNLTTGDYSRGCAGFMIRNGALAEPVAEITIAGHLLSMFAELTPADDLRFRGSVDAPTVRIDGMMVAGA